VITGLLAAENSANRQAKRLAHHSRVKHRVAAMDDVGLLLLGLDPRNVDDALVFDERFRREKTK